jgi:hypothetical protein
MSDNKYNGNTDAQTGNHPDDDDYDFCRRMGIPTIASQRRNASTLDRRMREQNDNKWFASSSAFTGD